MADKKAAPAAPRTGRLQSIGRFFEDRVKAGFARAVRKFTHNLGPCIVLFGAMLFLILVVALILLGMVQPKCFSNILPCAIEEVGKCLCSVRGADGTCWQRMTPAMKCYRSTQVISSGLCQGIYMTGYCSDSQQKVDDAIYDIALAVTDLHPNLQGAAT